jgi:hypothetical protein
MAAACLFPWNELAASDSNADCSRLSRPGWNVAISELSPVLDEISGEPPRFRDALEQFVTRFAPGREEDNLPLAAQELGKLARDQKIAAETAVVMFRQVWSREVGQVGRVDIWLSGELRRHRAIDALLQGYYGSRWFELSRRSGNR